MNKFALAIALSLFALITSTPARALDILDSVSETGKQIMDRWLPSQDKPSKAAPQDLPPKWRGAYIYDAIFDAQVFIAQLGSATKPAIFLVHGLGQNGAKDWLKVTASLEADYHIFLVDLPGFGYSDKPAKKLSPTAYAQLLQRLKQQLIPNQTSVIVGHSMGGAVALRFSDLYPQEVSQLVLVDAAGILQRTAFVKHSADSQVDVDLDALPNSLLGYAVNAQDFGSSLIEKLLKIPDPTALLTNSDRAWGLALVKTPNINAALALAEENFSRAVLTPRVKTSIIWGEKDPVAPLRTGQVLAHALTGDRVHIIEGAQHVPMLSHPAEFNALLKTVLQQPPPEIIKKPAEEKTLATAECINEAGTIISGNYRLITVKRCKGLRITDAVAQSIIIEDSLVTMQNVRVTAEQGSALQVRDSVIQATNIEFSGEPTIDSTHSRLDFAGAQLAAGQQLLKSRGKSRVIMSVSEGVLTGERGYLHGDYQLQDQRLEDIAWRTKR
jgi:pimeloyl-ACP methyl ester carboxylesterase